MSADDRELALLVHVDAALPPATARRWTAADLDRALLRSRRRRAATALLLVSVFGLLWFAQNAPAAPVDGPAHATALARELRALRGELQALQAGLVARIRPDAATDTAALRARVRTAFAVAAAGNALQAVDPDAAARQHATAAALWPENLVPLVHPR